MKKGFRFVFAWGEDASGEQVRPHLQSSVLLRRSWLEQTRALAGGTRGSNIANKYNYMEVHLFKNNRLKLLLANEVETPLEGRDRRPCAKSVIEISFQIRQSRLPLPRRKERSKSRQRHRRPKSVKNERGKEKERNSK